MNPDDLHDRRDHAIIKPLNYQLVGFTEERDEKDKRVNREQVVPRGNPVLRKEWRNYGYQKK